MRKLTLIHEGPIDAKLFLENYTSHENAGKSTENEEGLQSPLTRSPDASNEHDRRELNPSSCRELDGASRRACRAGRTGPERERANPWSAEWLSQSPDAC